MPQNVQDYIISLYSCLRGKIRTSDWISEEFSFAKGVFQGDPLSPIIFLMCFNPILEDLKRFEESDGYCLNGKPYISLPFADDFNLITRDVRKHKKLMTHLQDRTSSMGLKLKPRKCKSLSLKAGKSINIEFMLGDSLIGSILHDAHHRFLGGIYSFACSSSTVTSVVKEKISTQLNNINELLVRNEYKVRIYSEYFLGSLRFLFSVHDLHKAQLQELESLTHRYLKRWLGLPRGASWALVHDSHGLNIKSITHLYLESRSLSLPNIRFFSDGRVRHALDSKEDREGTWRRKFSSTIYAKDLVKEVVTPMISPENHLTFLWMILRTAGRLSTLMASPYPQIPPLLPHPPCSLLNLPLLQPLSTIFPSLSLSLLPLFQSLPFLPQSPRPLALLPVI